MPPFRPLCGRCELDGSLLNLADYMHDGWVYTGSPEIAEIDAVHLETGETLKVDLRRPAPGTTIDPATIPEYAARGLDYAPEKKLDVARLAALYDDGALIDESCMIIQMAGILSLAIVAIFGVALLLRPRRK